MSFFPVFLLVRILVRYGRGILWLLWLCLIPSIPLLLIGGYWDWALGCGAIFVGLTWLLAKLNPGSNLASWLHMS